MASINIGGENAGDAFYRYKMPKLQARIEGRGNGIKTNVVNCVDIAKALERPPDYVLKFFGIELGAQTKYDKKSGTSIVNGAHDASKLSELLESFIKKYVQCYACGNPETVVKLKKENILLKCKACGFVSEVDARLRLNTYIIKNPPENKLSKAEKKVKKAEKERLGELGEGEAAPEGEKKSKSKDKSSKEKKSKKKKGEAGADENGEAAEGEPLASMDADDDEEEEDDDDVVWMTDTSAEAMAKRAAEQLSAATAAMVTQGNIEAEREEAKRKEEAARQKAEEEEAARRAAAEAEAARLAEEAAKKLALEEQLDPEAFAIRRLVEAGKSAKEVAAALADIKGGPAGRMRALYAALLGHAADGDKLAPLLVDKKAYVLPHAQDPAGQLAQLVAVEHLLGVALPERTKEAPLLLKALYDEDLAEEELIVAWHKKADAAKALAVPAEAAKAVREAAAPFVEWLEEAESGSDDESDEE